MKILLVNPSYAGIYDESVTPFYPPLGIMYISSFLKENGHDVRLIDYDMDIDTEEDLTEEVRKGAYGLIGITATTSAVNNALHIVDLVRRADGEVAVVMGGAHPTACYSDLLKNRKIDFVVRGEGEESALYLVAYLEGKCAIGDVPNLAYRENGTVRVNRLERIENIDSLPHPDRAGLKRMLEYTPPAAVRPPATSIITSRGCTADCKFCSTRSIFGSRLRIRSVRDIINEITELDRRFNIREFHIMDDCFTADKKRALEFCDEAEKLGGKYRFVFGNGLRADQVDREILERLRAIGVKTVMYGVETGDERILKDLDKRMDFGRIGLAFELSKKIGFETWGFFMLGLPGDTAETANKTIEKAIELDPTYAKFLIFKPTPGTRYYDELAEKSLIFDFDYSHYGHNTPPVHRLQELSADEIEALKKKAYRRFYLRPSKILRYLLNPGSLKEVTIKFRYLRFLLKRLFS